MRELRVCAQQCWSGDGADPEHDKHKEQKMRRADCLVAPQPMREDALARHRQYQQRKQWLRNGQQGVARSCGRFGQVQSNNRQVAVGQNSRHHDCQDDRVEDQVEISLSAPRGDMNRAGHTESCSQCGQHCARNQYESGNRLVH